MNWSVFWVESLFLIITYFTSENRGLSKIEIAFIKAEITTFSQTVFIRLNQIVLSVKLRKFYVLIHKLIDILHKCYLEN